LFSSSNPYRAKLQGGVGGFAFFYACFGSKSGPAGRGQRLINAGLQVKTTQPELEMANVKHFALNNASTCPQFDGIVPDGRDERSMILEQGYA
jgi:hypothetical protein